jgi:hypothetical protein
MGNAVNAPELAESECRLVVEFSCQPTATTSAKGDDHIDVDLPVGAV